MKTVVTPGAFDTKGADYQFLVRQIQSYGVSTLTVDFGVLGDPPFTPDIPNTEVARAGGSELSQLRASKDKTLAMRAMAEGLARILLQLRQEGRLDGVCGMGGSGGTTILSAGVRGLPIGTPKLLISTVAAGDVSPYVGSADVTLMRTNVEENRKIGGLIAETANRCAGPAAVLLPLRGVSMLGAPDGAFYDPEADQACFEAIRSQLKKEIPLIEVDANINDPAFADRAVQVFLNLAEQLGLAASNAGDSKRVL